MNVYELREKYPLFIYHGWEAEENEFSFKVTYHFEIEGLASFYPTFTCPKPDGETYTDKKIIREAIFSLGMVELVSYWKITCSPKVEVRCGSLNTDQVKWWKKLYYHGLGEFFYINDIHMNMDEFMDLEGCGSVIDGADYVPSYHGNLIPVGGGKDSFVSMAVLESLRNDNHAFVINNVMSAVHAVEAAGYNDQFIQVFRTLDKTMLELNKQGYLNGHTPFSALAAFAAYLVSLVWKKEYICLSNESSANESTIQGETINHQYSKSFEFEQDFKYYVDTYLDPGIHYFSLLRPLSELQITSIFATLKDFHPVFKSCNVGSKQEVWCGHCAKCLFVYIMLSAFLDDEDLIKIFGHDLMDDPDMRTLLEELTGMAENKPFECVGTRDEVNTALCMAISRRDKLSHLFEVYRNSEFYDVYSKKENAYSHYFNEENLVPEHFEELVKEKLQECWKY